MVGVGRVAGLGFGKHQPLAAQECKKTVTSRHKFVAKHVGEHQPQLIAADAGVFCTNIPDGIDNSAFILDLLLEVCLRLVEGLTAVAK